MMAMCTAIMRRASKSSPLRGKPKPEVNPYNNEKRYTHSSYRRRRAVFMSANSLCVECQANGRIEAATVLDHIKPVEQGGDFYDAENWQALCITCHARKSVTERKTKHQKNV